MSQTGVPYTIQPGDTLWDLAATHLGDPLEWPRIYAFNNQKEVLNAGARRIVDPDRIYAGSKLHLPILPGQPRAKPMPKASPMLAPESLRDQVPFIQMPVAFAYDLEGDPIVIDYGSFVARIGLSGRVTVELGAKMPLATMVNGGIETSGKAETDSVLGKLIMENKVSFDAATREIKFSNKMIASSDSSGAPRTAIAVEVSSITGVPMLKGEIHYPELTGRIGPDSFIAQNFWISIEIEPRHTLSPGLRPALAPSHRPAASPTLAPPRMSESGINWGQMIHDAKPRDLIVAGVITVGFLVSLFYSGGTSSSASPVYANLMLVILGGGGLAAAANQ